MTTPADVFISYAHEDVKAARELASALQHAGFEVWWDHHIRGGARFSEETATALESAKTILVIWSADSIKSHWVADEASEGRDSGRLVPISIDGTMPPLGFRQFQTLDFSRWKGGQDAAFEKLAAALAQVLGQPHTGGTRRQSTSPFKRWVASWPVVALAVAALAGLGYYAWPRLQPASQLVDSPRSKTYSSIAVLPFVDLSQDETQTYLADGLADDLINLLARDGSFKVAARTSSFWFKGKDTPLQEIAAALNVETLVEGSVRRVGSRLRVKAQLVDAATGFQLWSNSFDRDFNDILAIQAEISAEIAKQLNRAADLARQSQSTRNPQAYDAYLRAEIASQTLSTASLSDAVELYRQAIQLDPQFGTAYARLANALLLSSDHLWGDRPHEEVMDSARKALSMAMRLAPDLPETLIADALLVDLAGNRPEAIRKLDLAVQRYPQVVAARTGLARVLLLDNRIEEALVHARKAQELDPLSPAAARAVAFALESMGRIDEAIALLELSRSYNPADVGLGNTLGVLRNVAGDFSGALTDFVNVLERDPTATATRSNVASTLALFDLQELATAVCDNEERCRVTTSLISGVPIRVRDYPKLSAMGVADPLSVAQLYALDTSAAIPASVLAALRAHETLKGDRERVDAYAWVAYELRNSATAGAAEPWLQALRGYLSGARTTGEITDPFAKYMVAVVAAIERDTGATLQALEAAERQGFVAMVPHDPRFAFARAEPRLQALLQRIEEHRAREQREAIAAGLIERVRALVAPSR